MTPEVTQNAPKAPKGSPQSPSEHHRGGIFALWRGLLVHFGFQKRPLCRPRDPLGVSWTLRGSILDTPGDFWLKNRPEKTSK